jgi:hypothetical protein
VLALVVGGVWWLIERDDGEAATVATGPTAPVSVTTATTAALTAVVPVSSADLVEVLDTFLMAVGAHDFQAAWDLLSSDEQPQPDGRPGFEAFWSNISLNGFLDGAQTQPSDLATSTDGALSGVVRVFFDQCDNGIRSVEDVRVVVRREGVDVAIDDWSSVQIATSRAPAASMSRCGGA